MDRQRDDVAEPGPDGLRFAFDLVVDQLRAFGDPSALSQPTAARARPYFLKAIARDKRNWQLWLELAWASRGADQRRALAEASRLNPLSPEIADYRARLAAKRKTARTP